MDDYNLIMLVRSIDEKLSSNRYEENISFVSRFTGDVIELPSMIKYKYTASQVVSMLDEKSMAIQALYERGLVSDDSWKEWILSEDPCFTPKINIAKKTQNESKT